MILHIGLILTTKVLLVVVHRTLHGLCLYTRKKWETALSDLLYIRTLVFFILRFALDIN